MRSRIKYLLYLLLALGLVLLIKNVDFREFAYQLSQVQPGYIVLVMALQLATMALLGLQWSSIIRIAGFPSSSLQAFLMNARGNVIDSITPGVKVGGEVARFVDMKKRFGMESEDGVLVVALQKIISISSFYLLLVIGLIQLFLSLGAKNDLMVPLVLISLVFGLSLLALVVVFTRPQVLIRLGQVLKLKDRTQARLDHFLLRYARTLEKFKDKKLEVLGQFGLGLLIWLVYAVKFYLVFLALGTRINFLTCMAITYVTYVVGMIPLLPGSIGSFEGSAIILLRLVGIPTELAVSISIVFRIATFWFELLASLVFALTEVIYIRIKVKGHGREKS